MEEVPMKRNDKGTTADLALQWTFREERTPSMLRYRDWIKRASRFVVDNDMVDAMVKHSTDINKLDGAFGSLGCRTKSHGSNGIKSTMSWHRQPIRECGLEKLT